MRTFSFMFLTAFLWCSAAIGEEQLPDVSKMSEKELEALPREVRDNLPVREIFKRGGKTSLEVTDYFIMSALSRLMYFNPQPEEQIVKAARKFQRDLGQKQTGELTLGQLNELLRRSPPNETPIYVPVFGDKTQVYGADKLGTVKGTWVLEKVLVDPPSSVNKAPSDNKYLKQGRGYFSVSGFAVSMEDTKLESDNPSIIAEAAAESANTIIAKTTDGFGGALAVGFDFTGPWRIEGEFSLRVVSFDRLSVDGIPLVFDKDGNTRIDDATIPISSLMGNIYYDLPKILGHPPYVGGGIGMVFYENLGVADDDAFGYQFIIGINTPINKNAKLGVEYRYFSSTDPEVKDITGDVDIHSFGFKLQYYWDSPAKKGRKKSR